MVLIEILLPLYDNGGERLPGALYQQTTAELTERFGGLTAHTRAPATGLWKPAPEENAQRDQVVIYEVMTPELDRRWWADYRSRLEGRFRQEQVVIRAVRMELI